MDEEVTAMASEFYVAEDGSIHRNPVTVANNNRNNTNTNAHTPVIVHDQPRTEYRSAHRVSEGRIICFWIFSITVSVLIAIGVTQGFGTEIYGNDDEFIATIGPFLVFAGALAGSILYGIFFAESVDYNLWAYVLSAFSAIGGIIAVGIAVAIICFVVMILFYILIIGFVIAIVFGIAGGS